MTRRRPRSGYSLVEVLIVMAILVIAGAIVVPSLRVMSGPYKVQGAVDSVRAAWAMARSAAIEQGRPYRFAVEPAGRHFRVAPDDDSFWSGGGGSAGDSEHKPKILEDALPAGVRFVVNGEPGAPPPENAAVADEKSPASGSWEKACVFLPDGTAKEDVRIVFQVRGAPPMQLDLRGLTGTSQARKLTGK